jgi:hypothetical protein
MRRWWPAIVFGGSLALLTGCGGPASKRLTPDEEKQFEEQQQKERQQEKREATKPAEGRRHGHPPLVTPFTWPMAALLTSWS